MLINHFYRRESYRGIIISGDISCYFLLSKQHSHTRQKQSMPLMPQSKSGSGTRGFLVRL